jgi:hypothetical protein
VQVPEAVSAGRNKKGKEKAELSKQERAREEIGRLVFMVN